MKKSKKIALIVASALIAAGVLVSFVSIAAMGFDIGKLNRMTLVTNTYTVDQPFTNVSVEEEAIFDICILPSNDESCKVVCHESDMMYHRVAVENDTLVIRFYEEREWYDYIGCFWGDLKVLIYLPQETYEAIDVKTDTGDVEISDVSCQDVNVEVKTGDVRISDVVLQSLNVECTTGDLTLSSIDAKTVDIKSSTGDIELSNVIAEEHLYAEVSTGDVELYRCDGGTVWIETSTGDIEGTLLTPKRFYASSSTGDVSVPHSSTGGDCTLKTSTGDIEITVG